MQPPGGGQAEPGRAAGDEGDGSFELHGRTPRLEGVTVSPRADSNCESRRLCTTATTAVAGEDARYTGGDR